MTYWESLVAIRKFRRGLNKVPRGYYNEIVERYDVGSLLDIGCGFGDTRRAIDRDLLYAGVDTTLQFLRESDVENLVRGRAELLPFSDSSFQLVTCRALIEHVYPPEPILAEMRRVADELIVIVWFLEPKQGESLRMDRRGFWDNRHDRERVLAALDGLEIVERIVVSRHVVWILK